MQDTRRQAESREAWKIVGAAFAAALWGGVWTIVADRLLWRDAGSESTRIAAVLCALIALPPWLYLVANSVTRSRAEDFIHHVMVYAAVLSFTGTIVVSVLGIALERAGFIGEVPLVMVWPVMAGIWGISIAIGNRRYQ